MRSWIMGPAGPGIGLAGLLVGVLAFHPPPPSPLLQRVVIDQKERLPRGVRAPDFRLATAWGDSLGRDQLQGTPSVLVFVTPTCPYCRKLKERLVEADLPDLEGRVVLISRGNGDLGGYPEEVRQLEKQVRARYRVVHDASGSVFDAYQVEGVPTSYRLDAEGRIQASAVGVPECAALVEEWVKERLAAGAKGEE